MKVLIGSHALKCYFNNLDRTPADYDFINIDPIDGCDVLPMSEETNMSIYNYCNHKSLPIIETPFGPALLAPLEVLKILKICSLKLNKAKHQYDLKHFLNKTIIPKELSSLIPIRQAESNERIKLQKLSIFFQESNFPRIINHDILHEYVNKKPMYKNILKDDSLYQCSKNKFEKLSYDDKKLLLFEEIIVFGIERDLLPRIQQFPGLICQTVDNFKKCAKSSDSAFYWFFKFSLKNGIKGTPIWQTEWIIQNQSQLLKELPSYWTNAIEQLSTDFWDEVLAKTFDQSI